MNAILYLPGLMPTVVSVDGLYLPDTQTGLVPHSDSAVSLLGCTTQTLDILVCGPGFVAYSVFDSEGEINSPATEAVAGLLKEDIICDNEMLRGPILLLIS